jgi:hypothetical protein
MKTNRFLLLGQHIVNGDFTYWNCWDDDSLSRPERRREKVLQRNSGPMFTPSVEWNVTDGANGNIPRKIPSVGLTATSPESTVGVGGEYAG